MASVVSKWTSTTLSTRSGVTCSDVIVVAMATLTLMTSRVVGSAPGDDPDVGSGQWPRGRAAVTWYDDVNWYRHNSVLQADEPTTLEEVSNFIIVQFLHSKVKHASIFIAHIRQRTSNALVRSLVIWDQTVLPATRQR